MSLVFPERLNKIDYKETEKALHVIEEYMNYMCERVDFAVNNVSKTAAKSGDIGMDVTERMESLESSVQILRGDITSLTSLVNSHTTSIQTINTTLTNIQTSIDTIDETITSILSSISDIQDDYEALELRVRALEERE